MGGLFVHPTTALIPVAMAGVFVRVFPDKGAESTVDEIVIRGEARV